MKRGSLRCELDSATPSGLQQATIGGTGGGGGVGLPAVAGTLSRRQEPSPQPDTADEQEHRGRRRQRSDPGQATPDLPHRHWLRRPPSLAAPRRVRCWRFFGSSRAAVPRPRAASRPDQWPHDRHSAPPQSAHWPRHSLVMVAVPPLQRR